MLMSQAWPPRVASAAAPPTMAARTRQRASKASVSAADISGFRSEAAVTGVRARAPAVLGGPAESSPALGRDSTRSEPVPRSRDTLGPHADFRRDDRVR